MINSMDKGKAYERYICKLLSSHFGIRFQRVPNSGAMQTAQHLTSAQFKGDIFTEDEDWNKKFGHVIECKKLNQKLTIYDWAGYLDGRKTIISDWLHQCKVESGEKGFILIFANDFRPDLVIVGDYKPLLNTVFIGQPTYLAEWLKQNV
jgi:hypothetical protein